MKGKEYQYTGTLSKVKHFTLNQKLFQLSGEAEFPLFY
jgi:hypothetical protein